MRFIGGEIVRPKPDTRAVHGCPDCLYVVLSPFYAELINQHFEAPLRVQAVDLDNGQAWSFDADEIVVVEGASVAQVGGN